MAGQALGVSIISSTVGGLLSAVFAVVLTPIVGIYALNFGPAELFMMAVFGMTAVGSLTGKSTLKGLFSSALGLFVACVGTEFQQGYTRASFGFYEMFEGFPLIPVLLGVFGFAELFSLAKEESLVEEGHRRFTGYAPIFEGIRAGLKYWATCCGPALLVLLSALFLERGQPLRPG